jgi:hypothetical protein
MPVFSRPVNNYEYIKGLLGDFLIGSGIKLVRAIDRIRVEFTTSGIPLLVFFYDGSDFDGMLELAIAFRRNTHNIHVILQLEKQFSPPTGEEVKLFHELLEEANKEPTFPTKCAKFKELSPKTNLGFDYRTNENPWLAIALTILEIDLIKKQEGYTKTLTFTYLTEEGCATETSPTLEEIGKLIFNANNPFGFIWQCFMKPNLEAVLKHYLGSYSEDINDFNDLIHDGIKRLMTDLQQMLIQYPSRIPDDHSDVFIHMSGPASFIFSNKELVAFLMKQRTRTVCSIMGFTELHLEILTLRSEALIRDPTATVNPLLHTDGFAEFIRLCLLNNVQVGMTTNNLVNDKKTGGANYTQDQFSSSLEFMEHIMAEFGITSKLIKDGGVKFYELVIKRKLFDVQSLLNFLLYWDMLETLTKGVLYFDPDTGSSIVQIVGVNEIHPSFTGFYEATLNNPRTISGGCFLYPRTDRWNVENRKFLNEKDEREAIEREAMSEKA